MAAKTPSGTDPLGNLGGETNPLGEWVKGRAGATDPLSGGQSDAFFKSAGGLSNETAITDYQEGGVGGGGSTMSPTAGGRLGVVIQGGLLGIVLVGALLAVVLQGGRGGSLVPVVVGSILAVVIQGGIFAGVVIQGGRGPRVGGIIGDIVSVVIQGGLLAVVLQGGSFPFFSSPSACTHSGAVAPAAAITLLPDLPCGNAAPTATVQQPTATGVPQATNTPRPQPTATNVPRPTNTPQPKPPHLSVSPTQTSAFCLNNKYPSITVKNTGGQTLHWTATGPSSPAVVMPSPASGSLAPGKTQIVSVSGSSPGPTVTFHFGGNGGTATVTYTCQ